MLPTIFNFPDSYAGNGLKPFILSLKHSDGSPVIQQGSTIIMQLRDSVYALKWDFSTIEGVQTILTILPDGGVQFPEIKSWDIKPSVYLYDLKVTSPSGFVNTPIKGTWKILPRISK